MTSAVSLRRAEPPDLPSLRDMRHAAVCWDSGAGCPDDVLDRPEIARLLAGWGRPGDAETPELGLAVAAGFRRVARVGTAWMMVAEL